VLAEANSEDDKVEESEERTKEDEASAVVS